MVQTFAVTALQRDNALDMALKTTYTAPKYSLIGTISQAGKVCWGASSAGPGRGADAAVVTVDAFFLFSFDGVLMAVCGGLCGGREVDGEATNWTFIVPWHLGEY